MSRPTGLRDPRVLICEFPFLVGKSPARGVGDTVSISVEHHPGPARTSTQKVARTSVFGGESLRRVREAPELLRGRYATGIGIEDDPPGNAFHAWSLCFDLPPLCFDLPPLEDQIALLGQATVRLRVS